MRIEQGKPRLSATDLANHLGCRHLTLLDLQAAEAEGRKFANDYLTKNRECESRDERIAALVAEKDGLEDEYDKLRSANRRIELDLSQAREHFGAKAFAEALAQRDIKPENS